MVNITICIILGLIAGLVSGITGIGGGIIILPALVALLGFSQHLAQGTTLALLVLPIDLLAAWTYYQQGYVNPKVAVLIGLGFFFGSLFGAKIGTNLSSDGFSNVFGIILLLAAVKVLFFRGNAV